MQVARSSVARLGGVLLLAASGSACGNDKGPPAAPSATTTPFVQSAVILGPETVEPGTSVQYSVELRWSNGATERATDVTWTSSAPAVLAIDASGRATASSDWSETTITAIARLPDTSGSPRAARTILVQPAGTFRLVGLVFDADVAGLPVPGARLEVRTSPDLTTPIATFGTTDNTGAYRLYGVPGTGYLHVRKPGYLPTTEPIQLQTHGRRDVPIRLEEDRLSLEGVYTMEVEATLCSSGAGALPPELRHRRYEAVITQSAGRLRVKLRDANFHVDGGLGDGFTGIPTPSGALVEITGFFDFYYYPSYPPHPALAELLPDGTVLVVNGRGTLTGTRERLSGAISGGVTQYDTPDFRSVRFLAGCYNGTVVTLTRR